MHLFGAHFGKPLEKFVNCGALIQMFKEGHD